MKSNPPYNFRCFNNLFFLFFILLISSCSNYYFSSPQPVDSKNTYKFPKQFRGMYTHDEEDSGKVMLQIFESGFKLFVYEELKIINGIYINPGDTIGFQAADTAGGSDGWRKHRDADMPFESTQSIKFDSLNQPLDTVQNYIVRGNKIYKIRDGMLQPGYSYTLMDDTIYCGDMVIEINLGPLAFLRKISGTMYVLNTGSMPEQGNTLWAGFWWEFFILEKTSDGNLLVRDLNDEFKSKSIYHPDYDSFYFDSQWTKNEMLKLLEGGDTTTQYKPFKVQSK